MGLDQGEPVACRHEGLTAGSENAKSLREKAPVITDMLVHVVHHHEVEGLIGDREPEDVPSDHASALDDHVFC
jgi:hypothetical protein